MPHHNKNSIDLILTFASKYHELYQKNEITQQQLDQISNLLDNFENYSYEEFKRKLESIFD
ncbi:MAG: hypothetical protein ACOCQ1_01510 [Halanaerobiaceae bacterium]